MLGFNNYTGQINDFCHLDDWNKGYELGFKDGEQKGRTDTIEKIQNWMRDNWWVEKELIAFIEKLKEQINE